ncbi:zinc finger domain, LSD1 subclass [Ruminococcus flavefaciens]|uniref:DNA-directed RNA polymerase subunit P n=1 Tax=Ruminococcus flavefaciens 007c TaxID=1341157 RepID=W7UYE5_RUMFL|nr:zinc finger domain, LSD1 subclass [Ruminococcus flavefaciens]EWM53660.1 hypothetical protein RF007C_06260 [Ruminococcus flavefaciens 007c]
MSDIIEYKCPACAGKLEFDSGSQKMKCPFCESVFDVDSLKEHDNALENSKPDEMKWESEAGSDWKDGETEGMRVYTCKSCGGEIIIDSTTAASKCPYCDNPVVMSGNFSGDLKPDYVIPFKYDKEAAKKALKNHISGRKLLPKVFKDQNHIDEIKGVYVPVWLFDAEAEANMLYKAEKIKRWSDEKFSYTERKFFSLQREGTVDFECVPVDGSTKMKDELMESIEPFNFNEAVEFQTAYLSGFLADKYDVSAEDSVERANKRIKNTTQQIIDSTVHGYDVVNKESGNIKLHNAKAKYALYPVWLLNTTWNGNKYTFAMNGQTGKFVGDLPVDSGAAAKWFFVIAAGVTAACFGLSLLLGL